MLAWNATAIFCEDIREEKSGQETIMGIFTDNLAVPNLPGSLAKFGVYFRIHVDVNADVSSITTRLQPPDGETLSIGNFTREFIKKAQEDARNKSAPLAGFISRGVGRIHIPAPGRVLALVNVDGTELICGSLNIILATKS